MDSIAFLLKTYREDYCYYRELISSFQRYNADSIRLYVVVPKDDAGLFENDDPLITTIYESKKVV